MSLQEINKRLKKLQNESVNCSLQIINIQVNDFNKLEANKLLYFLQCKSNKIKEQIKILEQTKKYINNNTHI